MNPGQMQILIVNGFGNRQRLPDLYEKPLYMKSGGLEKQGPHVFSFIPNSTITGSCEKMVVATLRGPGTGLIQRYHRRC